jgi:hypothetical protein
MSELTEKRWAVLSERGREASGLTYEEARQLERRLSAKGVHGLCIISARAASRIPPQTNLHHKDTKTQRQEKEEKLKIED